MSQSLSAVYVHLVFATKERRPFLLEPGLRSETHAYLGGISGQLDCPCELVGGVEDHVHILAKQGRGITQSDWVKELKRVSSSWLKTRAPEIAGDFAWQSGFGAFSVSVSNLATVRDYIARQEEHHRKLSFMDEYRALLQKHGVTPDERYLWD